MASMKAFTGSILGLPRVLTFRSRGTASPNASRTMRRWIRSFLATPLIVPTPWSYSRRICSNSSTLALLSNRVSSPARMPGARSTLYGFFPQGANLDDRWGAKLEYRNHKIRNRDYSQWAGREELFERERE